MIRLTSALLLPGLAAAAFTGARVQSPDAAWKTIRTAHYRIHYPAAGGFEPFAQEVASRIEGVHGLMKAWVGYAFEGPTDVLVSDPIAQANGSTYPLSDAPSIILWRTAPDSSSELAHGRDWVDDLVPHEMVHLHHLTWPDRRRGLRQWLQIGPRSTAVLQKCPAWVDEGYATLMEGRLTGMGRPHSAYRAQILRLLAREGRLPAYENLDQGAGRYLVSSAFLAWMEQQGPAKEKSLPQLWLRLSSSRYRNFDAGFKATFGQAPATAYHRFCAELTRDALEMERRLAQAGLQEGELWGYVPHPVQDLSLSPDGSRLLGRVVDWNRGGLVMWDLKARAADAEAKAHDAKRDPDLPTEAANLLPVRAQVARLGTVDAQLPERPSWTAEGVRYRLRRPDEEGVLHGVERTWPLKGLTPGASPIHSLRPAWERGLWVVEAEGKRLVLPFEPVGPLAWDTARKCLYASHEVQGIVSIVRLDFDPSSGRPFGGETLLVRSAAGALFPAPTPDGKALYFTVPRLKGAEIRRLDLDTVVALKPWAEDPEPFTAGTVRPPANEPGLLPDPVEPPPAQDYRVADSHRTWFRFGGASDPSGNATFLGVGGRDFLPRLEWEVLGAFSDPGSHGEGPRGAVAGAAWRGWAWAPHVQLFSELDRPSQQQSTPLQNQDRERRGGELGVERSWLDLGEGLKLQIAVAGERVEDLTSGTTTSRSLLWGRGRQSFGMEREGWSLGAGLDAQGATGRTTGQGWNHSRATLSFNGGYRWARVSVEGEAGRIGGIPSPMDRFQLGSQDHGLVPSALASNAVFQPALPALMATGDRFARWRAETSFGLYVEGISLWNKGQGRPAYLRVAGLEYRLDSREMPPHLSDVVRRLLGSTELRVGVHEALDGVTRHHVVGTLAFLARF